jgi:transcriptional regulator NrdR family protein
MKPCVGRARPHHPRRRCCWACGARLERFPALDVTDVTVVRRQATIENKIEKRRMNHTQMNSTGNGAPDSGCTEGIVTRPSPLLR